METYEQIADEAGLQDVTRQRFITYMRRRWLSEERTQCLTGYATEWAMRFARGIEYAASDSHGQYVLRTMDGSQP